MSYPSSHKHPPNHPPVSKRPTNISHTDTQGTVYVETAMPPPFARQHHEPFNEYEPGQPSGQGGGQPNNDVAGVLRRNQACLNCRRRKLKCDAARPNCGTCVRSYNHMLRTSPRTNLVLNCEYDDGGSASGTWGNSTGHGNRDGSANSDEIVEEDLEGTKKKKRKAAGEGRRKGKKDEDMDDETEKLRKKIEALEAQLMTHVTDDRPQPQPQLTSDSTRPFASHQAAFGQDNLTAPSPTAFLEMLSSAATAQATNADSSSIPGFRNGAAEDAMMSTTWAATPGKDGTGPHSGLTPFLSFNDNQQARFSSEESPQRQMSGTESTHPHSRRSSSGITGTSTSHGITSHMSSAGPSVLSPNKVFNFSPGPIVDVQTQNPIGSMNINWPPPVGPAGIQPSTRTEGPWRAVETASNTFTMPKQPDINMGDLPQGMDGTMDPDGLLGDEAMQQQLLLDLFWPGWPPNLPEPHIVNDLVDAFFDLVPNIPRLLHRSRLLARLALPPTHSNFPHPSLIHAICAASAAYCKPEIYERSTRNRLTTTQYTPCMGNLGEQYKAQDKYLRPHDQESCMDFGLKQAAHGKATVQDGLDSGNRMFDVVRAMIILSRVFIDDTRMLECWAYSGLVARMMLPLGLNVRSAELSLKSVMLPPPADALEREERRIAVWMAFYHDTIASSASGWGTSIQLDELSIPLPVAAKDFELGLEHMEGNPQDIDSPEFWTKHPVPDPFVMVMKATILINRVNKFVRRWKNRHLKPDDDYEGMQRPGFRELSNAAACLQMSFPPSMCNPTRLNSKRRLDIDLISAHMLPHAAMICLYEPFADVTDANDGPARRILGGAQGIISIVQQLAGVGTAGAANFTSVMHSSASVCLVTAARTSLLFYRQALNLNDSLTAESHRMDIEMIRMALGQFGTRFKIGHHHSQLLEYFLDRATYPTFDKLQAHYPEHPRAGAPELTPNSHLGICVLNALNVKRGFWRAHNWPTSAGVSPFGSTPESAAYASSTSGHGQQSSSNTSGSRSHVSRTASTESPPTNMSSAAWYVTPETDSRGQGSSQTDWTRRSASMTSGGIASATSSDPASQPGSNQSSTAADGKRPVFTHMTDDQFQIHKEDQNDLTKAMDEMIKKREDKSTSFEDMMNPFDAVRWAERQAESRPSDTEGRRYATLTKEAEAVFDKHHTKGTTFEEMIKATNAVEVAAKRSQHNAGTTEREGGSTQDVKNAFIPVADGRKAFEDVQRVANRVCEAEARNNNVSREWRQDLPSLQRGFEHSAEHLHGQFPQ